MILQVLYLICCIYMFWELWRRNNKTSSLSPPDLSGRLPLIGHAWKCLGNRKYAFQLIKGISEETMEKGGVTTIHVGFSKLYAISDPDDCVKVSNACLDKNHYYSFARPFLGNGLTIADVPLWKQHRKSISPTFRQQSLNNFIVVFNHQAKRLVKQFSVEVDKGRFNHEKYIRMNNLESICMTAFGADVAESRELHSQYLAGVNDILDIFTERFQKIWLHSDFIYNRSSLKARQDKVIKNIEEFTRSILEKKKAEMSQNEDSSDKSEQFIPFMNFILELSKDTGLYTDEDVLSEINTIVGGGYDTSACTNTLALMLIGSHPHVQKKLQEEFHKVFEGSDRDVHKDDLSNLVYLEAVLKETMRLYPIAPAVARHIVHDVQLKNYTLKAGRGVGLMFWAMHRNKVWGPDVEDFRPERWLDGSVPSNINAFAGFSVGKRGCIGKTYAMMSMKTTLSHVLRNYHVTSDISNLELELDVILRISSGQNISIEKRNVMTIDNK